MTTLAAVVDPTHIAIAADRRVTLSRNPLMTSRTAESKLDRAAPWCVITSCGSSEFSTWLVTRKKPLIAARPKNAKAALKVLRKFLDPWHQSIVAPHSSVPTPFDEKPSGIIVTPWFVAVLDGLGTIWPLDPGNKPFAYADGSGHAAAHAAFRTLLRFSEATAADTAKTMVEIAAEVDGMTGEGVDVVVLDRLFWAGE